MPRPFRRFLRWLDYRRRGLVPERDASGRIVSWYNPKVLAELRERCKDWR